MNQSDDRYSPGAGLENPVLIDNLSDGEWSDDDKIICKKSRAILDGSNNLCKSDLIRQSSQTKTSEPIADAETNDCRVGRIDDADKASMDTQTGTVMKCELATKLRASAISDFQKARRSNINADWEDSDTESIVVKWMEMDDRINTSCLKSTSNISVLINQKPSDMVLLEYPFGKKCTVSL